MGGHGGPPPEAYTGCEDKTEGDTAERVSPHGDTVTDTCEEEADQLVLRPDIPPDGRSRNDVIDYWEISPCIKIQNSGWRYVLVSLGRSSLPFHMGVKISSGDLYKFLLTLG